MKLRAWRAAAALLLLAPGLIFAQEQGDSAAGADATPDLTAPVQINSLAAPLSGSGFLTGAPTSLSQTALPPSALNAAAPQAAASDVAPKTAALAQPAQAAATASTPIGAPQDRTVSPAAQDPYFAQALAQLGASPALCARLGVAAARTPENPNAPAQTPDLAAAAAVAGPAGASLSRPQKIAVILSAVFAAHPELQARNAALVSEIEDQGGVYPEDVAALVQAAGFGRDAATPKLSAENAWISRWGRHAAFAAATAAAVAALARPKSLGEAVRAEQTLNTLRQSPEFAIFPSSVRRAAEALLIAARNRRRPGHPALFNEAARSQAPPANPAQARAIGEVRAEAADLGLSAGPEIAAAAHAAANPLSALKNGSFAVLSPSQVPDFHLESRILTAIDKSAAENPGGGFWQWAFLEEGGREWRTNKKQSPELVADVRSFVEGLTRELQAALPEENIAIRDVQIRVNPPPETGAKLHVDGGYITLTCALRGPGTVIYDDAGGRVRRLEAPPGAAAFVSNMDREFAVGFGGAVHAAPVSGTDGRVVLIVRYKNPDQAETARDARTRQTERTAKRIKIIEKFAR